MPSIRDIVKITEFFLNIAQWERHVEFTRQFLNGLDHFEPYSTFRHITKSSGNQVEISDFMNYLDKNGNGFETTEVEPVLLLYDSNSDMRLNYEEFLQIVLSKDNSDLRFLAANRQPFEYEDNDDLYPETDLVLSNLLAKEIYFLDSFRKDPDLYDQFYKNDWFIEIDKAGTGFIDFDNLKEFFNLNNIFPLDEEIIFILRRIDIDDDGRIDKEEFVKFINLILTVPYYGNTKGKDQEIKAQMRESHKNTKYVNYSMDTHERNRQPTIEKSNGIGTSYTENFESFSRHNMNNSRLNESHTYEGRESLNRSKESNQRKTSEIDKQPSAITRDTEIEKQKTRERERQQLSIQREKVDRDKFDSVSQHQSKKSPNNITKETESIKRGMHSRKSGKDLHSDEGAVEQKKLVYGSEKEFNDNLSHSRDYNMKRTSSVKTNVQSNSNYLRNYNDEYSDSGNNRLEVKSKQSENQADVNSNMNLAEFGGNFHENNHSDYEKSGSYTHKARLIGRTDSNTSFKDPEDDAFVKKSTTYQQTNLQSMRRQSYAPNGQTYKEKDREQLYNMTMNVNENKMEPNNYRRLEMNAQDNICDFGPNEIKSTMKSDTDYKNLNNQTPSQFQTSENKVKDIVRDEYGNDYNVYDSSHAPNKNSPFVSNWENQTGPQSQTNYYRKSERDSNTFTFNRPGNENLVNTDSRKELHNVVEKHSDTEGRTREYEDSHRNKRTDYGARNVKPVEIRESSPYGSKNDYKRDRDYQELSKSHDAPKRRSYDNKVESQTSSINQDTSNLTLKTNNQEKTYYARDKMSPTKNLNKAHYENYQKNSRNTNTGSENDQSNYLREMENQNRHYHETEQSNVQHERVRSKNHPNVSRVRDDINERNQRRESFPVQSRSNKPKTTKSVSRNLTPMNNKPNKASTPKKSGQKNLNLQSGNSSKKKLRNSKRNLNVSQDFHCNAHHNEGSQLQANERKNSSMNMGRDLSSNKKKAITFNGTANERVGKMMLEYIEIGKKVESGKQELALRPDYNIKDHFRCIDKNLKGFITLNEFVQFFKNLKITSEKTRGISRLFESYQNDRDERMSMTEFTDMMSPFQKEYKVLLNCRIDKGAVINQDIDKVSYNSFN